MMMMMVCASPEILDSERIPAVVVVDPRFEAYKQLAASARQGKVQLHLRSSGAEALKLAKRLEVDAWLIASDLDDMSGRDLALLMDRQRYGDVKLVAVRPDDAESAAVGQPVTGGVNDGIDAALSHPIALADLERVLGRAVEDRAPAIDRGAVAGRAALRRTAAVPTKASA